MGGYIKLPGKAATAYKAIIRYRANDGPAEQTLTVCAWNSNTVLLQQFVLNCSGKNYLR